MRVLSFVAERKPSFGVAVEGGIVDAARFPGLGPDLISALRAGKLEQMTELGAASPDHSLDEVEFLPVVPSAEAKYLCIGINYVPHMQEMGRDVPAHPVVFVRFSNSLVGHGQPMLKPASSEQFDYEGELAVIIGKRAHHVPRESAFEYVAGYSCFNDGSIRDFQRHSSQFTAGKNFVASGAFGPWMVTSDTIDPTALMRETRLNGKTVQRESTGALHFGIAALIEYISTWTVLEPGDVIVTGTPGGVGAGRTPPLWMQPGDMVEVDISGIGCLRNPIKGADAG